MSQIRILIDTNVYFRLAQTIHPLLKTSFGQPPTQIVITEDLEKEFSQSQRLQLKFGWFSNPEYVANRKGGLSLSNKQKKQFKEDWATVLGIANQFGFTGLSKADINGITYALILEISIVTDDTDMAEVASQLGVKVMSTLELLKMMLDHNHIKLEIVKSVAGYWWHMADCPKDLKIDYKRIFGEEPTW